MTQYQEQRILTRLGKVEGVFPVSHSRIESYDKCPAKYKFDSLDHLPRPTHPLAQLGTAFHDYVAAKTAGDESVALDVPMKSFEDFSKMKALADSLASDRENLAALEETVTWRWDVGDTVVEMEVRIDKLQITPDDTAIITDYKTGWSLPNDLEEDLQGLNYSLGVMKLYPRCWRFIFRQAQARFGRTLEITYDREKVERYEEALKAKVLVMLKDERFKPRPGDHCRLCPYVAGHCEVGKQLMGRMEPILDKDSAKARGEQVAYLEALLYRLKDDLKDYCDNQGMVELESGDTWGYAKKSTMQIPEGRLNEARRVFEDHGLDPDDYIELKLNGITARKFLRGRKAIPELVALAQEKPYTKFGLHRQKEGA